MAVKTFRDFVPVSRSDDVAWVIALLQEAVTPTDEAAVTIDTIRLDPVDSDPSNPLARTFTTSLASDLPGLYYRVVFTDELGYSLQPTDWIHDVVETGQDYRPDLTKVSNLIRTRLKDGNGNVLGRFTPMTQPTSGQALEVIGTAMNELSISVGDKIPDDLITEASELAAIRTAMLLELTYFPEQVKDGRSPYEQWRVMYEGQDGKSGRLARLVKAIQAAEVDGGSVGTEGSGSVKHSFPIADSRRQGWMTRSM